MNYKKILIGVVILVIVAAVIYYFYNKSKSDKEQEVANKEIVNLNQNMGGNYNTQTPPPVDDSLKAGDSLLAKYDGVKVYDTRNDLAIFKTVNKNGWVGTLKDNYSNENFYEISTPSRTTGLIVLKAAVKK